MNHLDNDFAKAAGLFQTYKYALSQKNNASLLEQTKDKIVVQFWKIIQKSKNMTTEMKEHSDLIVKAIINCLKTYPDKEPEEFCKLTYASIAKALRGKEETNSFEEKSGMHITDSENKKRKRILNAYKQFQSFNSGNKKEFIEYAIEYLGFEREDLEEYLYPKQSVSLYARSKNDTEDEYCVVDKYTDTTTDNDYSETMESERRLYSQLDEINVLWKQQKDDARNVLSDLITRELLSDYVRSNVSEKMIAVLLKPDFICKEMVRSFFNDNDYNLPTQQTIGQKYGLTKSAASVKLTRFLEKLKKR